MRGFTDKPMEKTSDDVFGVQQYISGLTDFILECNTPMTIAIQGDWGSGKTSMMYMIREKLGDSVITSWFNTWQYSQFNMGDSLAVSFLSRLVSDLEMNLESNKGMKKVLNTLVSYLKVGTVIVAEKIGGSEAANVAKNGVPATFEQNSTDISLAIKELKDQFQLLVNEKIKNAGKNVNRLVVFIDDLDRLNPGKAVELLEVLKVFLDCDNCVFVLAIDYAVVSQGVKQKYGELIGEEKGKSFFDKIIQVPFKMPVAQYNVENYVKKSLESLGMAVLENELKSYVNLIKTSVGCNPRGMKRLFNAFLLLKKIAEKSNMIEKSQQKILFAILCLQLSFENVYNYIVNNVDDCYDGGLLNSLKEHETYSEGKASESLNVYNDSEIANAIDFMNVFVNIIDKDSNGKLEESEMSSFIKAIRFSTITANTTNIDNNDDDSESRYRYYNRDIVKDILYSIQGNLNGPFKIYQTKTNNNPDWKRYYAGGWKYISTSFGKVTLEFKISTSIQNKESQLGIYIYASNKTDRRKYNEYMQKWYSKQKYGFVYYNTWYGFALDNKIVHADSRDEIIRYFTSIIPLITEDVENALKE